MILTAAETRVMPCERCIFEEKGKKGATVGKIRIPPAKTIVTAAEISN